MHYLIVRQIQRSRGEIHLQRRSTNPQQLR
jgi:hypothetical protein